MSVFHKTPKMDLSRLEPLLFICFEYVKYFRIFVFSAKSFHAEKSVLVMTKIIRLNHISAAIGLAISTRLHSSDSQISLPSILHIHIPVSKCNHVTQL